MELLDHIGILSPLVLLTVIPVAGLTILIIYYLSVQLKKYERHGIIIVASTTKAPISFLVVALLIIITLIRPYSGYDEIPFKQQGGDLMFLVDISKSMLASDLQPSRMDAVKRKIIDTIDLNEKNGAIARFGLTVYAGDGYTICPLTSDSAVLKQFTEFLSPDLVSSGGSNLITGVETAIERLDSTRLNSSYILLLTDGELDEKETGTRKFSDKIPINVIGFGTPSGASITLPNGTTLRDNKGRIVRSRLDEGYLKKLALVNGGNYVRATIDDSDIVDLSKAFQSDVNIESATSHSIRVYNELGPIVAAAALLCFSLIRLKILPLLLICIVFSLTRPHHSIRADTLSIFSPDEALEDYKNGSYAEAEERYRRLLKSDPTNRIAKRGLASTLLKRGAFSESQRLFHELAEEERSGRDFYENTFNEGNVLVAQGRYLEAIDTYNRALDVKPGDEPTLHNLSIARQLLEKEKQTPEPKNNGNKEMESTSPPAQGDDTSAPPEQDAKQTPSNEANTEDEDLATPNTSPLSTPSTTTDDHDRQSNASENSSPADTMDGQKPRIKEAVVSATPSGRELPSENATPSSEPLPSSALASPTAPPSMQLGNELSNEVKAWLESLPDSPLLIRRKQSAKKNNQDW